MALEALSPGLKLTELEADQSPPTSVEVRNTWIYISIPPYGFIMLNYISSAQGQLYHFTAFSLFF
jgi:hypothetical protein